MKSKILAALLLAAMTGAAYAAPPAFEDVDTDKNGAISAEEAEAVEGLHFDEADTNGDGSLSPEEYEDATQDL